MLLMVILVSFVQMAVKSVHYFLRNLMVGRQTDTIFFDFIIVEVKYEVQLLKAISRMQIL